VIFLILILLSCARERAGETQIEVHCPSNGVSQKEYLDARSSSDRYRIELDQCHEQVNKLELSVTAANSDRDFAMERFKNECVPLYSE